MENKYTVVGETNYAPKVVKLPKPVKLEGLDNLVQVNLEGFSALVQKDSEEGSLFVLFPAECRLSADFASSQNLFSSAELNADKTQKGYLDKSGRVRAIRLRGYISDCLLLPIWEKDMTPGLLFDTINGVTISEKYVIVKEKDDRSYTVSPKVLTLFPEHVDTLQFLRNSDSIKDETDVVISQKLHGTSVRIGNIPTMRKLSLIEKILVKLGARIEKLEYGYVFGSHHVVKGISSNSENFYGTDVHSLIGRDYQDKIPQGYIVYGEIIGYVPNTSREIQKNFTYNLPEGKAELYVYNVVVVTPTGIVALHDTAMREFCKRHELKAVPLLWKGKKKDIIAETWMDQKFYLGKYLEPAVPLSPKSPCDEGVVIRIDGLNPNFYKLKGPTFYLHETKELDAGIQNES